MEEYPLGEPTVSIQSTFKEVRIIKNFKAVIKWLRDGEGAGAGQGTEVLCLFSPLKTSGRLYSPVALVADRSKRGYCMQYSKDTECSCLF